MSVKLLTEHRLEFLSIKIGSTGSSEFTIVKIPHCWKSHVTAHLCSCCHMADHVLLLLLVTTWVGLWSVIVTFLGLTHLVFDLQL